MNGCERILAALRGEPPDRVPIMLHNFMMAAREAGFTQAEYRSDPQNVATAFIRAVEIDIGGKVCGHLQRSVERVP